MKAYWIDSDSDEAKVVDTDASLKDLYRMCQCECIDVAVRNVRGIPFDFVVDDIGLLVGSPTTVFDTNGHPQLVGSVVILRSDDEGDFAGLSDDDISVLRSVTSKSLIVHYATNTVERRTVLVID